MLDFAYQAWQQPQRRYAILVAALSAGYCVNVMSWGLLLSSAIVLASALVTYIAVAMFLSVQAELRNLSSIIAETKETVSEINKVVKNINEKSAPKLDKILDETQKTIPRMGRAIQDLQKTVDYVNGGAQTASTLFTPISGAAKIFHSIGKQFTAPDSDNENEESSDEREAKVSETKQKKRKTVHQLK